MGIKIGTRPVVRRYVGSREVTSAFLGTRNLYRSGLGYLFGSGEKGAWYDPSDWTTLFQDSAGTTPVTAVGQPVGKMLDKSGLGNHAAQTTAINRPVLQIDGNGKYYLAFNGTNSSMVTPSIDFSGTDKITVVAGVKKVGASLYQVLLELSTTGANNGSTSIFTQDNTLTYEYISRGTLISSASTASAAFAAPHTAVLSGIGNISGDASVLRVNGSQVSVNNIEQGAGNYLNAPLYIGARAGTSLFFNGQLYGLVVRGALSTTPQITGAENFMNVKTGAY